MKKLVVIGNSPDVLQSESGDLIDSFDVVIRLNDFLTTGFESYVGEKCDYALITFATKFSQDLFDLDRLKIQLFAAERSFDYTFLQKRMTQANGSMIRPFETNILSPFFYAPLNAAIGLSGKQRATIGLIAMVWSINHFQGYEFFSHGINFFRGQGEILNHYSGRSTPRDGYHEISKERVFFEKHVAKNFKPLLGEH